MQEKKYFDIIPPEEERKLEEERPVFFEKLKKPAKKPISRKPSFLRRGLFFFFIMLILAGIFSYFFIPSRAEIEIWPKTESKVFKTDLIVDAKISEIDLSALILPGEIQEAPGFVSQEFPSSGTKIREGKAFGIIRVYNAYSVFPQPLVATTRFMSAEGKLFRTPKKVVIPGGHYEEGKLIPGEIDIEVVADQPGEEYNIGPTTFSIPGFAGTARYTAFYAKSFEPMTGGFIKEVPLILEEDLERAKEVIEEKVIKVSLTNLKTKTSLNNLVLLEKAYESEIVEVSPLAKAGEELENFVVQAKAKIKALVFNQGDLNKFAKDYILGRISQGKVFKEDSLEIKYQFLDVDFKEQKLFLSVEILGEVYSEIEKVPLKEIAKGKESEEITQILSEGYPEFTKVRVKFWPFWIKKAPFDSERIDIKLMVD